MQQLTDPYRALGVSRSATDAEIKAAHRKLAKRYHPDAGSKSETEGFLRIQEAYRVLSDPLLRKEWDQKHAPGPVRADQAAAPPAPRRRPPTPKPEPGPAPSAPPRERAPSSDPRAQPRSSRAYTWSASEVPWWEERAEKRQSPGDAPDTKPGAKSNPKTASRQARKPSSADEPPVFSQQDFDVYNRSSGAAWSMAARAYFRKGDADLPRRGSFRHQGTQVVTAGRARSAAAAEAEAEARHRAAAAAAAATAEDVYATPRTQAHAAPGPHEGTTHIVRRSVAAPWPSLPQRLIQALVAWLPIAGLVTLASTASGDELMGLALMAVTLVLLVAVPRIAYIAALSTVLAMIVAGLFLGGLLLVGRVTSLDLIELFVGGLLLVGYVATMVVIVIGPSSLRPWSTR